MNDDDLLWDLIDNSASKSEIDDSPTIISLCDTIHILEKKDPQWKNKEFTRNIFIWQSGLFDPNHVDEVCKANCPEFLDLCIEYRNFETINGLKLSPFFGVKALKFIFPQTDEIIDCERFGCAPIRDSYFMVIDER